MTGINREYLEKAVFSDLPINWIVHAKGFYYAGMQLAQTKYNATSNKLISTEEVFNRKYTYKVSIYLLAHSIELLLKANISYLNKLNQETKLLPTIKYSHNIIKMVNDLVSEKFFTIDEEDYQTFELIDEYLKWFGRYYCPQNNKISEVIEKSFTSPDQDGLITFKHKIPCPETHQKLETLYQSLMPNIEGSLDILYLLHYPE